MHGRFRHPRLALLLALLAWLGQALPAYATSSPAAGSGALSAHCAHLSAAHHATHPSSPNAHDCCAHSACGCGSSQAFVDMPSCQSPQPDAQRAASALAVRLTLSQSALPWRPPSA